MSGAPEQPDRPDLPESPEQFVESVGWRFARSMPTIPHEYTLRGEKVEGVEPPPAAWHDWFIRQIREHGYEGSFFGRSYTYLEVGDHKYWVVGDIINRERLKEA